MAPRMLDYDCHVCGHQIRDQLFMEVPNVYPCPQCGAAMDRAWYVLRRERTQWDERDAVVVFRKPDGSIVYPGQNTARTPSGCERVVMRSLREVDKFEREHNVVNERMHFDRNGRGMDDKFFGKDL